ncbi:hypothetical protein AVEN_237248-1 [Araneus ventricosus]|uniref:Uncharacterized protein n=1 Tax=Araneus ventricosus TaxID=182803 RepID=A0A4Y2U1V4_ARAVE|nr:hypothetical protein AVEN_237248-1 [Araneus ventricosus]
MESEMATFFAIWIVIVPLKPGVLGKKQDELDSSNLVVIYLTIPPPGITSVAQSLAVGVWCKQSNTQDNGERRFIYKYAGKYVAQVQETIVLAQITNVNRQQFTGNDSSAL